MPTSNEQNDCRAETSKVDSEELTPELLGEDEQEQAPSAEEQTVFNNISQQRPERWYQGWKFEKDIGILIAIVTLIILAFQSWELRRTNEIANKSLRLADSAFVESKKSGEETSIRAERAVLAIEKSADAINVQANAAEQTVVNARQNTKIAEISARISNRAYLSIAGVTPTALLPGKKFEATVQFVNVGKTPAYQVHHVKGYKLGGTGIYEHEINEAKKREEFRDFAMGMSIPSSFIIETENPITQEESDEIMKGKKAWYVFGRITYTDIFREKHFTRYCFVFIPSKGTFESYHRYNDAN